MIKLTQFLAPENIRQGVICSSKKRALEVVGSVVASHLNAQLPEGAEICPIACFANLFKREKLGSTALGNSVALPHAKLPAGECLTLTKPVAVFLQLETAVDYEAADHREVDLIYAVLFPEQTCAQYKDGLAALAEALGDKNLLKHLRAANSAEEIWQVLAYADKHFAQPD